MLKCTHANMLYVFICGHIYTHIFLYILISLSAIYLCTCICFYLTHVVCIMYVCMYGVVYACNPPSRQVQMGIRSSKSFSATRKFKPYVLLRCLPLGNPSFTASHLGTRCLRTCCPPVHSSDQPEGGFSMEPVFLQVEPSLLPPSYNLWFSIYLTFFKLPMILKK